MLWAKSFMVPRINEPFLRNFGDCQVKRVDWGDCKIINLDDGAMPSLHDSQKSREEFVRMEV